ncbi:MAG: hypothetical protein ABJI69_13955, partial [Balneola sp.]
ALGLQTLLISIFDLGPDPIILYPFLAITLTAYYITPTIGIAYIVFWNIFLIKEWRIKEKKRNQILTLLTYTIILLSFTVYIIWWYSTNQEFVYL